MDIMLPRNSKAFWKEVDCNLAQWDYDLTKYFYVSSSEYDTFMKSYQEYQEKVEDILFERNVLP